MREPVTEIYHIRLNTGEDLVSEVLWPETEKGLESHIVLLNPMKIICVPSGKPGYVSLSLMQWIFTKITEEQEFNIFSRDILTMSKPNLSLKEYYKETVEYFNDKNYKYSKNTTTEQYLRDLEKELKSVEESDKIIDEDSMDVDLQNIVSEFISSLSSNNKGTLH